jgi:hypothetical protein
MGSWRRVEKDEGDRTDAQEARMDAAAELSCRSEELELEATRSRMRERTV